MKEALKTWVPPVIFLVLAIFIFYKLWDMEKTKPIKPYEQTFVIKEFGFRGHDYIQFSKHGRTCIVHNPDCHCKNE